MVCPFFANYVAAALTETWEIFFTALALDLALIGVKSPSRLRPWLGCGLAIGAAILLRPDAGLLLVAAGLYLLTLVMRARDLSQVWHWIKAGAIVAVVALACLLPWTLRNLHTLHEFQPLAPRYANENNQFVSAGFIRWVKTWIADYASVEEIYWAVPGGPIDAGNLPHRAFDSLHQQEATIQLLDDYNRTLRVTPELDGRFAALAAERVHDSPVRYYVFLPFVRIADMWLRPRTEILPCNTRWWEFDEDPQWLVLSLALGVVNLLYFAAGVLGLLRGRFAAGVGLLLLFVLVRSAFLGTIENPEPRYTMECYAVVIVLASGLFAQGKAGKTEVG